MWQVRIVSVTQQEKTRREQHKDSIEQYITRKSRKKRQYRHIARETSYEPNTTYKHTLIFTNVLRWQHPHQIGQAISTTNDVTTAKRSKLDQLVRRKRHRQTQLNLPNNQSELPLQLKKYRKIIPSRSHENIPVRKKKRKRYVPIQQHVRKIRERIRTSGRDFKGWLVAGNGQYVQSAKFSFFEYIIFLLATTGLADPAINLSFRENAIFVKFWEIPFS